MTQLQRGRGLQPLLAAARGCVSLCACLCFCLSVPASAELCVLVDVPHGRGGGSSKLVRAIRSTWGTNLTFFTGLSGNLGPEVSFPGLKAKKVPRGIRLWVNWARRWPAACSWILKVKPAVYLNLPGLTSRLRCLEGVEEFQYLGTPKIVSMPGNVPVKVAGTEGGIVLRRSLADDLPALLQRCVTSSSFSPSLTMGEDVLLGVCLWLHGTELQTWLDPVDEAFFTYDSNVFVQRLQPPDSNSNPNVERPWHIVITRFGSSGLSNLQCVLLVANLEPDQLLQLHILQGKSRRWFKNIACIPGGIAYPEFTGAAPLKDGDPTEPFFPQVVRTAMQDCFVGRAFSALQGSQGSPVSTFSTISAPAAAAAATTAAAVTAPASLESKEALVEEWLQPQPNLGPVAAQLRRGGHTLCIFVLATVASAKHIADAAAILGTWGSALPGRRPEGVEVFLVDRFISGPEERVLRLRGDVDLGFLFNTVRAFYLWRFLAEHHCEHCQWFMKVDPDTLLNTWTVKERLERYFDAAEPHYLGSAKASLMGSGRRLLFAVNSEVVSRSLLRKMGPWLVHCIKDLVERKLGRGAEDIDLAFCLDKHGDVHVKNIGAAHEVMSRGMARVASSQAHPFGEAGACTLWVHPVHGPEMESLHQRLTQLRSEALASAPLATTPPASLGPRTGPRPRPGDLCDWPAEIVRASESWGTYMKQTHAVGWKDCWMGEFTWSSCCDPNRWGSGGNPLCWDDEHNHERCCFNRLLGPENLDLTQGVPQGQGQGQGQGQPVEEVISQPASMTSSTTPVTALAAKAAKAKTGPPLLRAAEIKPMVASGGDQQGNPKCWDKSGFNFETCCLGPPNMTVECWVWPYSHGFCCLPPLPPRLPIQVGGLPQAQERAPAGAPHSTGTGMGVGMGIGRGAGSGLVSDSDGAASRQRLRSSRCREGDEEAIGGQLLACSHSLDELGALFELEVSGTGDKASGWHDYLGAYERLLLHLPLSANVLELGVRSGLSLAMWSEYFPLGQIVGVDKNVQTFQAFKPKMKRHGAFSRENVRALQANASDPSVLEVLREANASHGFADLILDDANHWAKDQIARFELLFPTVLKPGGIYIIEDVHIQAPFSHDGIAVRGYFANLSASAYLTDREILVGAHHIEAVRRASQDWRHQVEGVTLMRDFVAITKAA